MLQTTISCCKEKCWMENGLRLSSLGSGDTAALKWATNHLINHSWSQTNAFSGRALSPIRPPWGWLHLFSSVLVKNSVIFYRKRFLLPRGEGLGHHRVSSGCSSIIFKIRQDKKICMGVSTLKERRKGEILIYDLLQLCCLIHHAVPVQAAVTSR